MRLIQRWVILILIREQTDSEEGGEEYVSPEVETHAANFLQGLQAELGL